MDKNKNKRTCILILGMHRSGTSAISGCFSILDYDLGNQLMLAHIDNEKGYFENMLIYRFNDSLLDELYAKWHDTLFLPQNWWKEKSMSQKKPELISILHSEFEPASNFIIKDPRISVLLPFYLEVFNELNINTKAIISFRNPFEVANSLIKRDNLSMPKSLLLWVDANQKAELYSRTFPRVFLNFDSLLANVVGTLQKISDLLKLNIVIDNDKEKLLKGFIEKNLKHENNIELPEASKQYNLIISLYKKLLDIDLKLLNETDKKEFDFLSKLFYSNVQFYNGIDCENNFILKTITENSTITYSEKFKTGENKIVFETNNTDPIYEIILYPASRRLALQLKEVILTTTLGENISINPSESNAEKSFDDGIMIFESEFPKIVFKLEKPLAIIKISVSLSFFSMDSYTYRTSVKLRNTVEAKYLKDIKTLKQEKDSIENENKLKIEELESKQRNSEIFLKKIQLEKDKLTAQNDKLAVKLDEINVLKNKLLNSNENLQKKNNALKTEIVNLTKEKADILANNRELILNIRQLTSNNEKILSDFENSFRELQNKQQQLIEVKDGVISKYENELSEERNRNHNAAENLKMKILELSEEVNSLQTVLDEITKSNSWKIGRTLTWLIRKPKETLRD